jgi:hypothetical protein
MHRGLPNPKLNLLKNGRIDSESFQSKKRRLVEVSVPLSESKLRFLVGDDINTGILSKAQENLSKEVIDDD